MSNQVGGAIRVAIVAPPWYEVPPTAYGGIEQMCYLLVEGLVDRGHEVILIAAGPNHTRAEFVRTFEVPPREGSEDDARIEVLHAALSARALERLPVDVVHDHSHAGPLTARGRATPTVVTAHAAVGGPESQLEFYEAIADWVSLVALTEAQRRLTPHLGWVSTIHNGISVQEFDLLKHKEDFILYFGRMSPSKGVHLAIDAAREAGRRLVLAGTGTIPSERRYLDAEIVPRLGPSAEWLGQVDSHTKKELLARASCLIFPVQWQEPFGYVMLEAMASGTPVVALRNASVPELIVDGSTGVMCDTPSELPTAIEIASRLDPRACRAHVAGNFSVEKMASSYEAVYLRVLQRNA